MNDISRPAEIHDHGDGTDQEGLKDYTSTEIANRWKHQYIRRLQPLQRLIMADIPAERYSFLYPERSRDLLEPVPLPSITYHGEAGQILSQQRCGCAQGQITSLPRD